MQSSEYKDSTTLSNNFIINQIEEDLKSNKNNGQVITRFPPEPNGFLHIGHAKSIFINFEIAKLYNGKTYLRFDDTNPSKEEMEYVKSIKESVKWLGYDWEDRLTYSSDNFDRLYEYALELIKKGKAYVCELTFDEARKQRGTLTEPGENSPYRDQTVEENLTLFEKMRSGEFEEGAAVLRAKVDMSSPNMNMRDPIIYRILKASHHQTGDKWVIYPMYDFTHGLCDAQENVTHSLCTLEFEDHRPLYNWFLDQLDVPCHPQQMEFSRLSVNYTITSKRKLNELVQNNLVNGWDDPRMPTLMGLRRRGYTPESIKTFCSRVGTTKKDNNIEMGALESCVRESLENTVPRAIGVIKPIKLIIDNYPEGETEELNAPFHPNNESFGSRVLPFSKELYIEEDDFMLDAPKKYFRLTPGREVRLRYAYIVKCTDYKVDESTGKVTEVHCTYDPETKSGSATSNRKVKGTIHWVNAETAVTAEVRLYDRLFTAANPTANKKNDFKDFFNFNSLEILKDCKLEPSLAKVKKEQKFQFERLGYFCVDRKDSSEDHIVINRTTTLRDSWAKIEKAEMQKLNKK